MTFTKLKRAIASAVLGILAVVVGLILAAFTLAITGALVAIAIPVLLALLILACASVVWVLVVGLHNRSDDR